MPFCIGWVENFDEIALSCILAKIQNGCHMWEEEYFLKTAKGTLVRYPVGSLKSLYLARLRRQKQTCVFSF